MVTYYYNVKNYNGKCETRQFPFKNNKYYEKKHAVKI